MGMQAPLGLLPAVLVLSGAVLAGCAAKPEKSGRNAEPATSSSVAPYSSAASPSAKRAAPSDEPTISLPPGLPKTTGAVPPVDAFQQVTVQGRVRVSGSCVELVTDKVTWTLIGPAAAQLRDGQQAKAVGVPDPNRETACAGGALLVAQATPL
ncbi:hypothetical protein AB0M46_23945 [Dactylosporangium sp. NPDC051485]|uniref:hypothetical protein n=1 Tax=Dactylosporangium sp. NPDC051485 TaxID=3154846 RepID=UPI0034435B84